MFTFLFSVFTIAISFVLNHHLAGLFSLHETTMTSLSIACILLFPFYWFQQVFLSIDEVLLTIYVILSGLLFAFTSHEYFESYAVFFSVLFGIWSFYYFIFESFYSWVLKYRKAVQPHQESNKE